MSDTLAFAKTLLARPSITPKDEGCQQLIASRLAKLGFTITTLPHGEVQNLWARRGTAAPLFCFAGHTDVVPPGDLTAWQNDPFTPTLKDGQLIARGAADMKSSIAAMVTACERFVAAHPHHQGSIAFLITSDEEGMAENGTQAVLRDLEQRDEIPQWCLVGEASSEKTLGDIIKVGRRGSLTGKLKIIGKQGHVAYPQLAKNPIHMALAPLAEIAAVQWDQGSPPFPPTTLQFANIHAGTGANNVIPGVLTADFNLRFCPQSKPDEIKQKVAAILEKHRCDYEIDWRLSGEPFYTQPDSHLRQTIAKIIQQTFNIQTQHLTSGGTSDGRFFAKYGTEVVELGPNNATIHQVNECIHVEELEQLSRVYEEILIGLLV